MVKTFAAKTNAVTIKSAERAEEKRGILAPPKEGILAGLTRPKKRVWEIDFLRGFCVFLMILDHTAFMLAFFFGPEWYGGSRAMAANGSFGAELCTLCRTYWFSNLRDVGHPVVLFIFFSISGISCAFSRSNLKRGFQLAVVAAVYSLASYIAQEKLGISEVLVTFGVLHFYAVCILVWAAICAICRNNTIAKTLISGALVITVACLYYCYKAPATTPEWLYFLFPFENADGTSSTFYSVNAVSPGDLFTLIPWSAFFFAGTFLQPILYPKKRSLLPFLDHGWQRPMSFIGRHALLIYVLHIVIIALLLMVISQIFFGTWGLI